MTPEQKKWIDEASLYELLKHWRFAPPGDPMFQLETGRYYEEVLRKRRAADPEGWTQASKDLGW